MEDRTNPLPNSQNDVDDTLEATYAGTERPVKVIDERNDPPVFTDGGIVGGASVRTYDADIAEDVDTDVLSNGEADESTNRRIAAVYPATDPADDEDDDTDTTAVGPDTADDLLTYSLSGRDAKSFVITGSVDFNETL